MQREINTTWGGLHFFILGCMSILLGLAILLGVILHKKTDTFLIVITLLLFGGGIAQIIISFNILKQKKKFIQIFDEVEKRRVIQKDKKLKGDTIPLLIIAGISWIIVILDIFDLLQPILQLLQPVVQLLQNLIPDSHIRF